MLETAKLGTQKTRATISSRLLRDPNEVHVARCAKEAPDKLTVTNPRTRAADIGSDSPKAFIVRAIDKG